jgi:hypothetical protein
MGGVARLRQALRDVITDDPVAAVDRVAELIHSPASDVRQLLAGGREFAVSEIVVVADAFGLDWRPILLRAAHCTLD